MGNKIYKIISVIVIIIMAMMLSAWSKENRQLQHDVTVLELKLNGDYVEEDNCKEIIYEAVNYSYYRGVIDSRVTAIAPGQLKLNVDKYYNEIITEKGTGDILLK